MYINMMLTDFFELRGDRQFGDDPAIVGGVGSFDGRPIVILGHQIVDTEDARPLSAPILRPPSADL